VQTMAVGGPNHDTNRRTKKGPRMPAGQPARSLRRLVTIVVSPKLKAIADGKLKLAARQRCVGCPKRVERSVP
jgi:hypothetical protein